MVEMTVQIQKETRNGAGFKECTGLIAPEKIGELDDRDNNRFR
jgi:hypothetical protein